MLEIFDIGIVIFGVGAMFLAFGGTTIGDTDLAFGGDRWTERDASFFSRITARGWFSLLCFFVAIGLGIQKEKFVQQTVSTARTTQEEAEQAREQFKSRIEMQISEIADLQQQVRKATKDLSETDQQIEAHHLLSMETAFKLTAKSVSRKDESVLRLDGREIIPIPSRSQAQMRLAGGDQFYFTTFIQNLSAQDLGSLQLEVGGRMFPLFKGDESGFFERTLRLPGNPAIQRPAALRNPLLLEGLTLKIIVQPKDISRKEDPFRKLVLNSPFSTAARRSYRVTKADMLNVRLSPEAKASLVTRIRRGAYVRILNHQAGWAEILTPEGKQGWVTEKFLAKINP